MKPAHFILSSLAVLFSLQIIAQIHCCSDHYKEHLQSIRPSLIDQEADMNAAVFDWLASHAGEFRSSVLTVPVVVHIIHQNGVENISDEDVELCIEYMNDAYHNANDYFNEEGVDTGISFCLAKRDPDGEFTTGINRVEDVLTEMIVPDQDQDLKDLIRWDTEQYLNIWLVRSVTRAPDQTGVIGYSSFPEAHGASYDGIVCEAEYFGATQEASKVMVHEAGHYLGLYHTFQDGCPNDDCMQSGDRVCDTPPDQHLFNTFCFDGTNSCATDDDDTSDNNPFRPIELGGLGDQVDFQTNYMDYSNLTCFRRFTQGQGDRMCAMTEMSRSSLFGGLQCVSPCDNPIEVNVLVSNFTPDVAQTVDFTNLSNGFTTVDWYVDGVLETSSTNLSYAFPTQGEYEVTLVMGTGDISCEVEEEFEIIVTCPIDPSFTISATAVGIDEDVIVTFNGTEGATVTWYVDGVVAGSGLTFTTSFTEPGNHSIQASASDGICTVISSPVFIQVGSCTSGNEHNIWNFYPEDSNFDGLDFNGDNPPTPIPTIPLAYSEGKTTLCDQAGNLQFTSNGMTIWGADQQPIENGTGLLGHLSSRQGVIIVKYPGTEDQYLAFTQANNESNFANGLRYSVIDGSANGGLGAVTEVKNVFLELTDNETMAIVRHCNLKDLWLLTYNNVVDAYHAFLISDEGVSSTPVESPFNLPDSDQFFKDIKVSPKGDMFLHNIDLMGFNQQSGEVEQAHHFDVDIAMSSDWSPDGKKVFMQHGQGDILLTQYLVEDIDGIEASAFNFQQEIGDFAAEMKTAPDGKIYIAEVISGYISVLTNPNGIGVAAGYSDNAIDAEAFINSFGNFYHGYISGQTIFVEGEEVVCEGQTHFYSLHAQECIEEEVEWEIIGNAVYAIGENGVSVTFDEPGEVDVIAFVDSDCGVYSDTLSLVVGPELTLDLGLDQAICEGQDYTIDAGPGFTTYEWQDGSTNQTFTTSTEGIFNVSVTNDFGCEASDEFVVEGILTLEIDLGPDTDLCDGDIVILDAGNDYSDFEWQDGSTGQTYTVYEGGTYTVTAASPCFSIDEIFVDGCGGTIDGVGEEDPFDAISIYPNPVNSELTLRGLPSGQGATLFLWDLRGRKVFEQHIMISKEPYILDVSNYAEGSYELQIRFVDGDTSRKLVILTE